MSLASFAKVGQNSTHIEFCMMCAIVAWVGLIVVYFGWTSFGQNLAFEKKIVNYIETAIKHRDTKYCTEVT